MSPLSPFPEIGETEFDARVARSKGPVLVEFTNAGCGLCKILAPALADLAEEYAGEVDFVMVDTDASPGVANAHNIQSVPQLLMFRDGVLQERLIGLQPRGRLAELVESQLEGGL